MMLLSVLLLIDFAVKAQQPTVSYGGPQTYTAGVAIAPLMPGGGGVATYGYSSTTAMIGSGFSSPVGVAIDAAGNIYVADAGNSSVFEIPAGGGSPVSIGSGFSRPTGITVDNAGNIYVADPGNASVFELSPGGATQQTLSSYFIAPDGVAVDAAGNVYVADEGSSPNTGTLYKLAPGSPIPSLVATSFNDLTAVAIDRSGNVYVADGGLSEVFQVVNNGFQLNIISGGFLYPNGLATDAVGNLYVTDGDANTVYELFKGSSQQVALYSAFNNPGGVTVDAARNVYIGDTNNSAVEELSPVGGYFVDKPLPKGLKLNDTTGVISGTPRPISPATDYTITAYNASGSAQATLNITVNAAPLPAIGYQSPKTYQAGTAISPLMPSNAGAPVASPAYGPDPAILGTTFNTPSGVALDAAGNIYVADAGNSAVEMIPRGGGTPAILYSSFDYPTGVAVDAAGNVYVADEGAGKVYELAGGSGAPIELGAGTFTAPDAIAVDAAANVYVTDENLGSVWKIPAGNGTPVTLASGFYDLTAIISDASGNLYLVDGGSSTVFRLAANSNVPVEVAGGFLFPTGVAVDALGNIYVTDGDAGNIFKIRPGSTNQIKIASGLNNPSGLAIDLTGNLYLANSGANAVDEINPTGGYFINTALPAGLSLSDRTGAISGTATVASAATDYLVTGYNTGGGSSATVNITVTVPPPPVISYVTPPAFIAGITITPFSPSNSGGPVSAPAYSSSVNPLASGFQGPDGVALDASGNIYVADQGNGQVDKIPAGGGTPVPIGGSSFQVPNGVAVDAAGNVYVTDAGNQSVIVIPGGTGTPTQVAPGFFGLPTSIAVDAAGNIYVGDSGFGSVFKIPPGSNTPVDLADGFGAPSGIAVDAAGNVYVTDEQNGFIAGAFELPAGGGKQIKIGSGFTAPTGVAVDASGNIFIADGIAGVIKEVVAGSGATVTITGAIAPFGIAADNAGNLYTSDEGDNTVKGIKPIGGYYISAPLPAALSFNSATGTVNGTPVTASLATAYTVNAYNPGGNSQAGFTITVNFPPAPILSYTSPQSYAVGTPVLATPSTSTNVAVPAYSNSPVTLGSGFQEPVGVAVDALGNVYVADIQTDQVTELPAGGGAPIVLGTGYNSPSGIAVDAVGNVYVASVGDSQLTEILHGGGTASIGSGLNQPVGLAVDAFGNIYVADSGNNAIKEIPAGNGTPIILGSGFNQPSGVAVDAFGNVYVADSGHNKVKEIPVGGGAVITLSRDSGTPTGVAVDAQGDLFITDALDNAVKEIPVGGTTITIGTGFNILFGVSTDAAGDVFVADAGNSAVKEIKPIGGYFISRSLPVGLSFDGSSGNITGTPTALSPATNYNVTAYNSGASISATVNIAVKPNTTLSLLAIGGGTLSPAFTPATTGYSVTVAHSTSNITLTPTTTDPTATVQVNLNGGGNVPVTSGSPTLPLSLAVGNNSILVTVTSQDGSASTTYNLTVARPGAGDALLSKLSLTPGVALTLVAGPGFKNYNGTVANGISSIQVIPTASDANATIKIGSATIASGSPSAAITLSVGANTITVEVTAQNGTTVNDYIITITRRISDNAFLSKLSTVPGLALTVVSGPGYKNYTGSVANNVTGIQVKPTAADPGATITVDNAPVQSGDLSQNILLSVGDNPINITVTAADLTTQKTYIITITRTGANNALLTKLSTTPGTTFTAVSGPGYKNYTTTVASSVGSIKVTPTTSDPNAKVTVGGQLVASGSPSQPITLDIGQTTINTVVTAQDGTTMKTYIITVTRGGSINIPDAAVSMVQQQSTPQIAGDGILVHQAVSPNGDGVNDYLTIENITNYPDNSLKIMNPNGTLVFEAKNYDNTSKVFDGHSNKTGQMQQPGTYFYSLDYTVKGVAQHKTGFIVLKY